MWSPGGRERPLHGDFVSQAFISPGPLKRKRGPALFLLEGSATSSSLVRDVHTRSWTL